MSATDPVVVCNDSTIACTLQNSLDVPLKDIVNDNIFITVYGIPIEIGNGNYVYTPETGICIEKTMYTAEIAGRIHSDTLLRDIRNPLSNTINIHVSHGAPVLIHVSVNLAKRVLNIPVYVHLSDTAIGIKHRLYMISGLKTDQQRLLFAGRQLIDSRSLEDQGITENVTITLIARLRSGQVYYVGRDSEYCSVEPPVQPVNDQQPNDNNRLPVCQPHEVHRLPVCEMKITSATGSKMLYVHPDLTVDKVNEYLKSLETVQDTLVPEQAENIIN